MLSKGKTQIEYNEDIDPKKRKTILYYYGKVIIFSIDYGVQKARVKICST